MNMKHIGSVLLSVLLLICFAADPVSAAAVDTDALPEYGDVTVMQEGEIEAIVRSVFEEYPTKEDEVSVGFCYTATGECGYYNADTFLYSASLYKLPLMMHYMHRVYLGEISEEDIFGGYTLKDIEEPILVASKNDPATALLYALNGPKEARRTLVQYSGMSEDELPSEYYTTSLFSGRYMLGVLKTLYYHQEEYPHIIELMKQAEIGRYMRLNIEGKYEVGQKYGEYEGKRHSAGIIYTPNPILVVVMTNGGATGEEIVGRVSEKLCEYALTLDSRLEEALTPATPEPTPEPTPSPTPEAVETPAPTAEITAEAKTSAFPVLAVLFSAAAVSLLAVFLLRRKKKRRKHKRRGKH